MILEFTEKIFLPNYFRDFTGGTLGLAWVASASGASGGICETYKVCLTQLFLLLISCLFSF